MASYRLTRWADRDIRNIADYTIERFGIEQAREYRDGIIFAFQLLAEHPRAGSDQGWIMPGLRRLVHQSHGIYYRIVGDDVVIERILGPGQDPLAHLGSGE